MDSTPLITIEQRLSTLERRICTGGQLNKGQKCLEELALIQNSLQSAVTGRERITSVFSKLENLEKYLSPNFKENITMSESAKMNLVLLEEDRIRNVVDALQTVKDLQQYLDSEHVRAAPSLFPKLSSLSQTHVELNDQVSNLSEETRNMIAAYDEIIMTISKQFILWDSILTKLETEKKIKPCQGDS